MDIKKEQLIELVTNTSFKDTINPQDIPDLDLYMDQVITLFENKLSSNKRNEDDKILTKTMVNNYAKDKLLLPIKNKKYSKENILILILIYNLKQSLSIADIKLITNKILQSENTNIIKLYEDYVRISICDEEIFIKEVIDKLNNDLSDEEYLLFILSLINKSNMYKKLSENLIDNFLSSKETK